MSVEVEGLGKRYRQYADRGSLGQRLLHPRRSRQTQHLWALRDVDFTVPDGGTLGIIGRNGSGKTTLLRLLSGVTAPSAGRIRVAGRIAPLIGIGVGFNQELTGRENVVVNGRLLGMTRDEVERRFDDIVEFAELWDFIDVPVKFYSSGMFLRLAFSVAIHTNPDVMLVDEILAVGDIGFQSKCFDRMRELQDGGATVLVVTHNLQVLERLTKRTIVLHHGRVVHDGDTDDAMEHYHRLMATEPDVTGPGHDGEFAHIMLQVVGPDGPTLSLPAERGGRFVLTIEFDREVEDPVVGVAIERPGFGLLWASATEPGAYHGRHGPDRPLRAEVSFDRLPLLTGTYRARAVVHVRAHGAVAGSSVPTLFQVVSRAAGAGAVSVEGRFTIEGDEVAPRRPRLR